MVFYFRQRDAILKEAVPLDRKRNALERLLYVALCGKEVPEWNFLANKMNRAVPPYPDPRIIINSKKFRSDAKWYPYGQFIVNWNVVLVENGITNVEERAQEIGLRMSTQLEIEASDFTAKQLRRVLDAHHEGRFNDDQSGFTDN